MFGVNIIVNRYDTVRAFAGTGPASTVVAGTQVFFVTGDPNGVQTATRPAVAYDATGAFWEKTGAGTNNTGWERAF